MQAATTTKTKVTNEDLLYLSFLKELGIRGETADVFLSLKNRGECPACYLGDACPDLHTMDVACDYYCG